MKQAVRFCFAAMLSSALLLPAVAQESKGKSKQAGDRLSGRVQMVNKETSTISLQRGNSTRQVVYNPDTRFEMGSSKESKVSTVDQVKVGYYMYCGGTFEGAKLIAKLCRFRPER